MRPWIAIVLVLVSSPAGAASKWVSLQRPDGSKQCEPKPVISSVLAAARKELRAAGIRSRDLRHAGDDGRMRMQVCGSPTGSTIHVQVRAQDQARAESLGFSAVSADPGN